MLPPPYCAKAGPASSMATEIPTPNRIAFPVRNSFTLLGTPIIFLVVFIMSLLGICSVLRMRRARRAMSRGCQIEVIFLLPVARQELSSLEARFHSNTDCRRREVVLASAFRRALPGSSGRAFILPFTCIVQGE